VLIRNARAWPGAQLAGGHQAGGHQADAATLDSLPRTDVRLAGGLISECGTGLRPAPGEPDIDAAGGLLLPGLHDHHVHLRALAAAAASVAAGPPQTSTADELAARLRAAGASLPPGSWLRAVGYHESVAGELDRDALDRLLPHRPVRVQHRTGALWMVNSLAAERLGLDRCELAGVERDADGRPTGRLWRLDRWLAERVPGTPADLGAVSRQAAALGVTGFTEATPGATSDDLASLAAAPVAQRLHCMAPPGITPPPEPAASEPAAGGQATDGRPAVPARVTVGPEKVLLDDTTLPSLEEFAHRIGHAHADGRPVAVHCVTRVQLVLTLAALDLAGRRPGDRIEHGAIIAAESMAGLRGLTVVTQPHFVVERGEQYAADVPPADQPDLWRLRSLIDAGVSVVAGTDAPYGAADPWQAMRAAARRPARFRPEEAVSPATAVALFLGEAAAPGRPRLIAPGHPADLVLLRASPREALGSLASDLVAATLVGGELVYACG
jgi:predicted amidohydrolase YtcJ